MSWRFGSETPRAKAILVACLALIVLGAVGLLTGVSGADRVRTFGALIASWLFFAGLSVGALTYAAIMSLAGARWAEPIADIARGFSRFIPVAAGLLLIILLGMSSWAPWYHHTPGQQAFWLDTPLFATREILGSFALFGFAMLFLRPGGKLPGWVSVTWCLLYAAVVSMWAFDFILGPDLHWMSTLIGPHLFAGAFVSGSALSTIVAIQRRRLDRRARHDAGALVTTLSVFWGYLFWSQFLTIWYGNLPDEVEFFLRRNLNGWQIETLAVVFCVFLFPLLLLLMGRAKESPTILSLAAGLQLAGLWMEKHLLVVPSLSPHGASPFDWHGELIALGILAAFVLASWDTFRPQGVGERADSAEEESEPLRLPARAAREM